jgi:hypothetical protein
MSAQPPLRETYQSLVGFRTRTLEKLQAIQEFLLRRKEWEKESQDEIREIQKLMSNR